MSRIFKYIFLFTLGCQQLSAQFQSDSLIFLKSNFQLNNAGSSFEKQLNTYNLNTFFTYSQSTNNFFGGFNHRFISTVVKSNQINIKDEQYISFLGEYDFSDFLKSGISIENSVYDDDRKLAINQSSTLFTSAYAKYTPTENIKIIPFLGLSRNKQIGVEDEGYTYGAEAIIENVKFDEFDIHSVIKLHTEDIAPRKNVINNFKLRVHNEFERGISNSINGTYSKLRKDFYIDPDSLTKFEFQIDKNIQSRSEENYILRDKVSFNSQSSNVIFDIEGGLAMRNIERETKFISLSNLTSSSFDNAIEELKLDFKTSVSYNYRDFNGMVRLSFSERTENHIPKNISGANEIVYNKRKELEEQKNNKSQLAIVTLAAAYELTQKDFLTFSLFHRKLKYDTPSKINFDDRDELLSIFRLYYLRKLTPAFNVYANLEGSFNKLVYIYSARSSNNSTTRVLKFSSGGDFSNSVVTSKNNAEVLANYTVYDFEDLNPNFKSYSFRQFLLKDSSQVRLNKNVKVTFIGYVKLSEQGDFNWTDFKGRPIRFIEESYLEPKIEYAIGAVKFAAGIRVFELRTFKFLENRKTPDTKYESYGPISEINYQVLDTIYIKCAGWYEFINNEQNYKRELVNLSIQVNWKFL